jgi:CRISPR-associated exonuclease Cas4
LGCTIVQGEIFYHANRRRQKVPFTTELRQMTEQAIADAIAACDRPMPAPIDNPRKCQACSLQEMCLPKEMRLLKSRPELTLEDE